MARPLLMGILNVTPDSFSDGGKHLEPSRAVEAALRMIGDGADIIDVGGESTRPGSEPVSVDEEIHRVVPVIEQLRGKVRISIDTTKPEVARRAIGAGAEIVNDVRALREPGMLDVCAEAECTVCLMHMQGEPRTMQQNPTYQDVVAEVRDFLLLRAQAAMEAGVNRNRIWIDPGIGFGKTTVHNLKLIDHLDAFVATGYPVLVGVSRKAFVGKVLGSEANPLPVDDREEGTLAVQVLAQQKGATIIRAHEVRAARRAIEMTAAVLSSRERSTPR